MTFKHIHDCWEFFDQFKTLEELEEAFGEIPSKFGSFEVVNISTYEQDGFFEICNSYWDENCGGYDYEYHCVDIKVEDDRTELPWDYGKHFE